jgi:hypothetical protein
MKNWTDTLLSQYANSPTVTAIIDCLNQDLDPQADLDAFYDTIWNVATAIGYGLDVWGKIVNVKRGVTAALPPAEFGFAEAFEPANASIGVQPFNVGVFNDGAPPVVRNVALDDETYRTLVMTKAMANITDCSCASLSRRHRRRFRRSLQTAPRTRCATPLRHWRAETRRESRRRKTACRCPPVPPSRTAHCPDRCCRP